MRFLLNLQFILSLLGWILVHHLSSPIDGESFALGAGLTIFNLLMLGLVWPLILAKKFIALSVGVIVFKFAILAWIIDAVANSRTLNSGWFAVGLGLVMVSVLATAFESASQEELKSEPTPN